TNIFNAIDFVVERPCQFIGGPDLTPAINMNSCQLSSLQRRNTRSPAIEQFHRIPPEVTLHRPDADASTRCTENLKSQQRVRWLLRCRSNAGQAFQVIPRVA